MTIRDNLRLSAELADQLRADTEALPLDHPLRRWIAAYDAAMARRQEAEAREAAAERAAQDAEDAARDARLADLRRRLDAVERKLR